MSNRRVRLLILAPALAGSFLVAPAALAWTQAAAVPAATCSISGVLPNGMVRLSGGGFTPGSAFLSSPTAAGGSFAIGQDGGFQMANVENAKYTVSQGNDRTECSGFKETNPSQTPNQNPNQNDQNQNNMNNQNNHQRHQHRDHMGRNG
ncbi:hypothetical protein [Streptomyces subrutilus]|uniref:Uncharacterized protein n=1 Tax=Streptomyces subrutilus TaxID=36818 RepID=A0A5P2UK61_9ACTN|nr:hypothetical protein [Streptomyces subrutilus]QEU77884.1 hypothetical protein CP968_05960 [Streptomyces subrutilus]WSJ32971.1 hypothetical protein OG479_28785 [Streptomyces subrutilus]GGZ63057.1 hypothetical protein GCM10010371_23190 [Streptomyces subrutilus]